jgi:hypothetical protein
MTVIAQTDQLHLGPCASELQPKLYDPLKLKKLILQTKLIQKLQPEQALNQTTPLAKGQTRKELMM